MDYRDFIQQQPGEIHFWHRARLRLIRSLCERALHHGTDATILDVGCGTGTEIPLLATYGLVTALDTDERALKEVSAKGYNTIVADISSGLNMLASYSAVCAFDVLEHIDDDRAAMHAVYKALKPGGSFLITVPAYQWLYGEHDKALEHFRRYSKKELIDRLSEAGFVIRYSRYWNTLLFPAVALMRFGKKISGGSKASHATSEAESWGPVVDPLLHLILSQEATGALSWLRFFNFGLSIAVIAQKP